MRQDKIDHLGFGYQTASAATVSSEDFVYYGMERFAYVRRVCDPTGDSFTVSSADGTELGIFERQDTAMAFAIQHDLEPMLAS